MDCEEKSIITRAQIRSVTDLMPYKVSFLDCLGMKLLHNVIPPMKKRSNDHVSKIDQLQCIKIAVKRFLKLTSSFDRFFNRSFLLDRLLIGGIV